MHTHAHTHSSGPGTRTLTAQLRQGLHYFVPYLRARATRPAAEVAEVVLTQVAITGGMVALAAAGHGPAVLSYYFVPNKLAILLLAWAFDYVPHRPHRVARAADPYAATARIDGVFSSPGWDLTLPLLYQNYHNIHHLYPTVPFYRCAPPHPHSYTHRERERETASRASPGRIHEPLCVLMQLGRYASIWQRHRDAFLQAGTPVAPLYAEETPWL
jgi:fatty acid desaturase